MELHRVTTVFFSPTHTTAKAIAAFASGMSIPFEKIDLTTPGERKTFRRSFGEDELAVVGLPVYGGRLPRNLDDFFAGLNGCGAPAVAMVVYGNREYDDALLELKLKLEELGFNVRAAATFIGEHSLSRKIASGRPDTNDLMIAADFGKRALASIVRDDPGTLVLKGSYPFVATQAPIHTTNPRPRKTARNAATAPRTALTEPLTQLTAGP